MPQQQTPPQGEAGRQTFQVSEKVRQLVTGQAIAIQVPAEMRHVSIDYIRDAGGVVVEASHSARWILTARTRTERVFVGTLRDKVVLDVELATRHDDASRHIVMRGRGEELYYGHDYPRAVAAAAKQALERLSE